MRRLGLADVFPYGIVSWFDGVSRRDCPDRDKAWWIGSTPRELSRAGQLDGREREGCDIVPCGTMASRGIESTEELGRALRAARRARQLRLEDVALAAGVGIRFVSELERGKATAQVGHTLRVMEALGVRMTVDDPLV
jgi:HTH-type transcriptional regulator/antitoxin HipB